jgi:hypothetical protein
VRAEAAEEGGAGAWRSRPLPTRHFVQQQRMPG